MSDLSDEESRNQKIKCQTCGIEFDQMEVEDHITNCHRCEFCDKLLKNKRNTLKMFIIMEILCTNVIFVEKYLNYQSI